ncbi:MAG: hypothetical protein IJZ53_07630 [Tyzzerella sp.]|nr:hypothetical protein [Tyzzerella sp.]
MIEHTYKDLYNQDSVSKQLKIVFDDREITNTDLYSESFELKESLCSEEELRFGSCEASVLKFKIANTVESLKNKILTVSEVLNGLVDEPFQFGKYKVYSDVPSGDRNYRNVTAYDSMYDIINTDVAAWYESLTFPITQKEFRDSFFEYFGIKQEETVLIHDDMSIEKTVEATSISGKDIITAICELNGVFGHVNRQGNFEYVSLEKTSDYLYPSMELYPSETIYPNQFSAIEYESNEISTSLYISCEYEDFETSYISKLQIRQEENDIGAIYGSGTNCYIIEDNFLVYGKSAEELQRICLILFGKIGGVSYRPYKATVKGNPCLEVGDMVLIHTPKKDVEGYILERTLKGIQSLTDTLESKGVYEYAEKVNSVQRDVKKLKGKTNVLERTVEALNSTIEDEETGLKSQVKQLANSVAVTIDEDGNVKSSFNLDKNGMAFVGNKVVFKSENFNLDEDGNLSISGRYEVEYTRTIKAENYTSADVERMQQIIVGEIEPTEEDLQKYDFKGTGVDGQCVLFVNRMVSGVDEWYKFKYTIVIDPSENAAMIRTKLVYSNSSNESEREIGNTKIGGAGICTSEITTDTVSSDEYATVSEDGTKQYGVTGEFTTTDGQTVKVVNGIVTYLL